MNKRKTALIWALTMAAIVGFYTGLIIWKSDGFQQAVFPKKYWTKKVEELEQKIKADERLLKYHEISLAKKKELEPI
jgi:uncharacterized membrane protein YraQ (UPF0718 family)